MDAVTIEQHGGPWTVADVLALDEERRYRYELLGESQVISPAPGLRHQRASHRLANLLEQAARAAGAPVEACRPATSPCRPA